MRKIILAIVIAVMVGLVEGFVSAYSHGPSACVVYPVFPHKVVPKGDLVLI